jgi:hypothetical protein
MRTYIKKISILCIIYAGIIIHSIAQTPVEKYGQLSVKGNHIVDKNGNPVQLRGMSLYWSQWKPAFYNASCIKWLRDDWCVSVVRAAMAVNSGGLATNPNEKQKIFTVIDACIANGIYVIVDYHDHTANTSIDLAKSFFNEVSAKYKGVPNILYEPWNEPLQVSWPGVIKPYHQAIVEVIRKNDPYNIIICGTANWSQQVGDPANDPVPGTNIAYTLHYYAASHKQWLRDAATSAMKKGIALFVTEYGTCEASGNGVLDAAESKLWWDFLEQNSIGHCNWSCADLGETSAALITGTSGTGNWPTSALKPSGVLVRDYLKSKCTSVTTNPIPIVTIDSPVTNTNVCSGTSVTINVSASISNGTISKVDFYDGNTLLNTDNSSPYSYTWNGVYLGLHTIKAIATSTTNTTSSAATTNISVNALPPTPTVTSPVTYCQNTQATALAATGTGFKWYNTTNGGTGSATAPTPITTATGTTNYYVSQSTNACESNRSLISVTVNPSPTATITSSASSICVGSSVVLTASAGNSYKWFNGTIQVGTAATYTATSAGAYTVEVTNVNACKATSAVTQISVSPLPTASITAPTTSFCAGSSAVLTASAGTSYKWFNGTTQVGTVSTYTTTTAGAYSVEVTNASGCKATSAATDISVSSALIATITTPTTSFCTGGSGILTSSTGASYKWFNGTTQVGTASAYTATTAGAYTVEVINASGCKGTSAVTQITVNALPTAIITAPATSFCTGSSTVLTASSGSSYKWFNGTTQVGTAATYTATTAGAYTVEVTNASGCKATSAVTPITVTNSITWYADTDNDGKGDPSASLQACTQPSGYVSIAGDACPIDPNKINPGNCGCGKTETSCLDCAGTPNGRAVFDNCKICVGGTTGNSACVSTSTINGTSANITVIPQPFDLNTSIQLENQGNIQSITIISASGAIVKTIQEENTNEITLGEDLASGLYSVIIQSEKGMVVTKIVKK